MARIRHLPNAPIREALIDLRVELPEDLKADQFFVLKDRLAGRYPQSEELRQLEVLLFRRGQPAPATPEDTRRGLLLRSNDKVDIAQFRVDGFTFSRLKPYTSWDKIRDEARQLWDMYVEVAATRAVTRIAVRYINT